MQILAYLSAPKRNPPEMYIVLFHSKFKLLISADENLASEVVLSSIDNINLHVNLKILHAVIHSPFAPAWQTTDHDVQINVVPLD